MDTPQANGPLGYRPISRINGSTPGMQKGGPTFSTPMAASVSASSLNAFASELGFAKTSKASPRSAGPLTRIRPGSRQGQQSSDGDAATPLTVPAHAKTSTLQLPEKRARGIMSNGGARTQSLMVLPVSASLKPQLQTLKVNMPSSIATIATAAVVSILVVLALGEDTARVDPNFVAECDGGALHNFGTGRLKKKRKYQTNLISQPEVASAENPEGVSSAESCAAACIAVGLPCRAFFYRSDSNVCKLYANNGVLAAFTAAPSFYAVRSSKCRPPTTETSTTTTSTTRTVTTATTTTTRTTTTTKEGPDGWATTTPGAPDFKEET
eukprot:gene22901-2099_t